MSCHVIKLFENMQFFNIQKYRGNNNNNNNNDKDTEIQGVFR